MWTRSVSHWFGSHLSLSSVLNGSVQSKHMDCVSGVGVRSSVYLLRPLTFIDFDFHWLWLSRLWLSSTLTFTTLTFIGLHCLESALDRGTAGVLINTPPNLCFPRAYLVPFLSFISFLCLPTLVVDLSTEVPLPFQWTTLAEEFCKAFPDYAHHMFFSILYSCAFRGW